MSFRADLKEMINGNYEPSCWQSCGQVDEINSKTHFLIATVMPNTGLMCGGDGCVSGAWAWFNDVNDLIDYVTHYAIPINLCVLEGQNPMPVMSGDGDEHIFELPFSEKHVPIKEELRRLSKELQALKRTGADYLQIKKALLESSRRNDEIDGDIIFGFMCFDNLAAACKELLRIINPLGKNKDKLTELLNNTAISQADSKWLRRLFTENGMA